MSNGMKIYEGQTVLVTGASRGIGNAIATLIKELGARVITVSTKNEFDGAVSDEHYGVNFLVQEEMDAFIIDLAKKEIDVVINNAGVNKISPFVDIDFQDYNNIQTVNTVAPFRIMKAVLPGMEKRQYGRIVNISSIFGVVSKEYRASYSVSKYGLYGMTTALALEVAKSNILVNCVSPGFINTELTAKVLGEDGIEKMKEQVPVNRLGQPHEVAEFVSWVASKKNTYMTGQNIVIDGGFTRG